MELTLKVSLQKIKKTISNNEFLWYDNKNKKLTKLQGGTLNWKYDRKEKRMVPILSDYNSYEQINNYSKIEQWVNQKQSEFDFYVTETRKGHSITINIKENQFDDISRSLYTNRIIYD